MAEIAGVGPDTPVITNEVGAKQFRQELDAAGFVSRINVRINSGGGDAFAGIAIHGMLKAHPAEVVVTVEGLAASAASRDAGVDAMPRRPGSHWEATPPLLVRGRD